jgi:DNA polymerase
VYRDGRDPYKEMAAKIVGRSAAQITPEERQLGKVCVLALSYGMGHAKFEATCSKMGVDLSKFRLDAERVVQIYREANRRITILWRAMENAASHAYVHGRGFVDVGLPGKERQIVFEKRGDTLTMKLPSGRCLSYPHIMSAGGRLSYTGQITGKKAWGHIETYGAKLVENCTQAVSRDILAEAILRLETESRASVVMHVHDEIEAEISEQDDVLAEYEIFKGCMLKVPDWAPGLPLKVETWISKRYKK